MNAVEFTTELTGTRVLAIPEEIAQSLPSAGRVRVIVLTDLDADDSQWRLGAYQQFLRDDSPEDADYESLR